MWGVERNVEEMKQRDVERGGEITMLSQRGGDARDMNREIIYG